MAEGSPSHPTPLPLQDGELPRVPPTPATPSTRRGRHLALGVVLALAFVLVARIAAPLWAGIAFGTVMAFTAQPSYRALAARLGERRRAMAAGIVVASTSVVTVVVGSIAIYVLSREALAIAAHVKEKLATHSLDQLIGARGAAVISHLGFDDKLVLARLDTELHRAADYAAEVAATVLSITSSAAVGLVIGLMTMYYVLLEWPRMPLRLEAILPLDPTHTRALILEFRALGRSALIGTLATAAIQGTLAGIGYALTGVPQPIAWALVTAVFSLVPAIGTALVWAPIGLWLISTGHTFRALIVLLWGTFVVVGVSDYVIRPRVVRSKAEGNPLLVLVSLLGGLEVFGLPGLIVGPIAMGLFLAVLRIYERDAAAAQPPPR